MSTSQNAIQGNSNRFVSIREHNDRVNNSDAINRTLLAYENKIDEQRISIICSRVVAVLALVALAATWH
jgi:hypothetical protein